MFAQRDIQRFGKWAFNVRCCEIRLSDFSQHLCESCLWLSVCSLLLETRKVLAYVLDSEGVVLLVAVLLAIQRAEQFLEICQRIPLDWCGAGEFIDPVVLRRVLFLPLLILNLKAPVECRMWITGMIVCSQRRDLLLCARNLLHEIVQANGNHRARLVPAWFLLNG